MNRPATSAILPVVMISGTAGRLRDSVQSPRSCSAARTECSSGVAALHEYGYGTSYRATPMSDRHDIDACSPRASFSSNDDASCRCRSTRRASLRAATRGAHAADGAARWTVVRSSSRSVQRGEVSVDELVAELHAAIEWTGHVHSPGQCCANRECRQSSSVPSRMRPQTDGCGSGLARMAAPQESTTRQGSSRHAGRHGRDVDSAWDRDSVRLASGTDAVQIDRSSARTAVPESPVVISSTLPSGPRRPDSVIARLWIHFVVPPPNGRDARSI